MQKFLRLCALVSIFLFSLSAAASYSYTGNWTAVTPVHVGGDIITITGATTFTQPFRVDTSAGTVTIYFMSPAAATLGSATFTNTVSITGTNLTYIQVHPSSTVQRHDGLIVSSSAVTNVLRNIELQHGRNCLRIYSSQTIVDKCFLQNLASGVPAGNAPLQIFDCAPRITRVKTNALTGPYSCSLVYTSAPAQFPTILSTTFTRGTAGHILINTPAGSPANIYLEGNFFTTPPVAITYSGGASPVADTSPDLSIECAASNAYNQYLNAGTINGRFYVFNGDNYRANGALVVASGAQMLFGVDRDTTTSTTYTGNGTMAFASGISLTVQSAATFTANGVPSAMNTLTSQATTWAGLTLQNGALASIDDTKIQYATTGLNNNTPLVINNSRITDCTTGIINSDVLSGTDLYLPNHTTGVSLTGGSFSITSLNIASSTTGINKTNGDLVITNGRIYSTQTGAILSGGTAAIISGVNINGNTSVGRIGIHDSIGSTITGCTFESFGSGTTDTALSVNTTAGGTYTGNVFRNTIRGYAFDTNTTCTFSNNNFNNTVIWYPVRVLGGAPIISANVINNTVAAVTVRAGSPIINGNTIIGDGAADVFVVSGGTPTIQRNTASNYGIYPVFNLTGGNLNSGNIGYNNFTSASPRVSAGAGATGTGGYIRLENNWWAANPPAIVFSGPSSVDYEPWLNAQNGTQVTQVPVLNSATIAPANGASLSLPPTSVTFSYTDVGFYNTVPMNFRVRIYNNVGVILADSAIQTQSANGASGTLVYAYPFAIGNTYRWDATIQNSINPGYSALVIPSFNFSVSAPHVDLVLSTVGGVTVANAGQIVTYNIQYTNAGTYAAANAVITSILPNEVYANGGLIISGASNAQNGILTATAYSDNAGTVQIGSVVINSYSSPVYISNSTAGWVPAAQNHLIRRINVQLQTIPQTSVSGYQGNIQYGTVVK